MPLYSRTTIEGGKSSVQLFTRGESALNKAIEVLDEILVNNTSNTHFTEPASRAKEDIRVLLDRVKNPVPITNKPADEDAGEVASKPAA